MPPIIDVEDRDEVYLAHHFHLQRVMDAKARFRREPEEVVVVDVRIEDSSGRMENMGKEWWEDQRNVAQGCMEKGQAMVPAQYPAVVGYNRGHGRVQMLRAAKRAVLLAGVVVMALWTWYGIGTGWTGQWASSHRQFHHEPITTTTGGAAGESGFRWDDVSLG